MSMNVTDSFYTEGEIAILGLKSYGKNVRISRKVSLYGIEKISIGSNVRIDDFCILSGEISIGSYVHIAAYCGLFGKYRISMEDFSGLSARVCIYTASDDYFGNSLTNPTVPDEFRKLDTGPVHIGKHVIVGAGTVILPDSKIGDGSAVGALSLVKGNLAAWGVYNGTPAILRTKRKSEEIARLERELLKKYED